MKITIKNCARCEGTHEKLEFVKFKNPPDPWDRDVRDWDISNFKWWAMCPTNNEPILLMVPDPV